ncbi:MAG: response regulator [Treponema sp.]|nr:response regulator [Treponema sp.]
MDKLDILFVEDDPYDAKLVESAVRRSGIEASWTRVDTEAEFLAALDSPHDVLLTDFKLPSFNALKVLDLVAERGADFPALVVTGAIDDELAADCVKHGAADYLLKDRLARIGDAIQSAIARHRAQRERRQAEEKLLVEARARIVLHAMLARSLARGSAVEGPAAADVLAPLLEPGAVAGLVGLRYEREGELVFEGRGEAPAAETFELRRGLDTPSERMGTLVFVFDAAARRGIETGQFLDQAAAAFLGHLVRGEAERRLVDSLAEKEELLREIHHRVKNNLAAVAGLISLEAERCVDEAARNVLVDLGGRISSMALVHEMLYARGGFTGIDFQDYARELAVRVAQSVGDDVGEFAPLVECPKLRVPLEAAVTFGIMLSELYSRSVARGAGGGSVSVTLRARESAEKKGVWRVEYTEKGGLDARTSPSGSEGSSLISDLYFVGMVVAQYGGSIVEESGTLRVEFDLEFGDGAVEP